MTSTDTPPERRSTMRTARTARRIAALALVAAALPAASAPAADATVELGQQRETTFYKITIKDVLVSSVTATPRSGAASMDLAAAPKATPILVAILVPAVQK